MERIDSGEGFSVLDGGALVMGSAIASIHILGCPAVGPFRRGLAHGRDHIHLGRRDGGGPVHLPGAAVCPSICPTIRKIGDRLWAMLGIPWLVTALVQSAAPSSEPRHNPLFIMTLSMGLAIVCLIALAVVWSTWVMVPPEQAAQVEAAPGPTASG